MKISKEKLNKIITEEISRMAEEQLSIDTLDPEVQSILSKLSIEEQSIILQYIRLLKSGDPQ
jgi:hypothetical protein